MGELAALASAAFWAGTSVALARLGGRYSAPVLSSLRLLIATPLLAAFALAAGGFQLIAEAPALVIFAMVVSGLIGYGLGDTAYLRSIPTVGLHRLAPTTTAVWVAMSAVGGIFLLSEPFGWDLLVGGTFVVAGSYLIVARATEPFAEVGASRRPGWLITAAIVTAVAAAWAAATLLLAGARGNLDATAAGVLRIPTGGLAVAAVMLVSSRGAVLRRLPRGRDLALVVAVGLLGTGIGSWLYIFAVAEAGAARAVLLSSTSPLMALPLSMLLLRERPTQRIGLGTVMCLAGAMIILAR